MKTNVPFLNVLCHLSLHAPGSSIQVRRDQHAVPIPRVHTWNLDEVRGSPQVLSGGVNQRGGVWKSWVYSALPQTHAKLRRSARDLEVWEKGPSAPAQGILTGRCCGSVHMGTRGTWVGLRRDGRSLLHSVCSSAGTAPAVRAGAARTGWAALSAGSFRVPLWPGNLTLVTPLPRWLLPHGTGGSSSCPPALLQGEEGEPLSLVRSVKESAAVF